MSYLTTPISLDFWVTFIFLLLLFKSLLCRLKVLLSIIFITLISSRLVRGALNKFPDFFLQTFTVVVDSWKFSMLLIYLLWDDWPIFMISCSNEQLQQQLEYTLLKPDFHSWWISKLQSGRVDTFGRADQFRSRSSWFSGDLRWNLDLPETKRQGSQWKHAGSPRPKKARQSKSTNKLLTITFLTALVWSTCPGFPLDRQSTRNSMLRFYGS